MDPKRGSALFSGTAKLQPIPQNRAGVNAYSPVASHSPVQRSTQLNYTAQARRRGGKKVNRPARRPPCQALQERQCGLDAETNHRPQQGPGRFEISPCCMRKYSSALRCAACVRFLPRLSLRMRDCQGTASSVANGVVHLRLPHQTSVCRILTWHMIIWTTAQSTRLLLNVTLLCLTCLALLPWSASVVASLVSSRLSTIASLRPQDQHGNA